MKEQFDKKLIEKIKISFEDHEEPFNPQEWEKLSHAYFHPARKKKFAFWPFLISGIAASLLLVFVFWPFEDELQQNVQTIADSITIQGRQFEKIKLPRNRQPENLALAQRNPEVDPIVEKPALAAVAESPVGMQRETIKPIIVSALPSSSPAAAPNSSNLAPADMREDINQHAANEKVGAPAIAYNHEVESAQRYLDQWKAEGDNKGSQEASGEKNVRLGLLVGPQASSNQVSGMSLGAGVMSEFSISKRLKIDVGVTYASHNIAPDNMIPMNATMASPEKEAFASLSNSPRLIGSNAELSFSGLDIPVNLKYKVMDKDKSGLFLITGLSSMVYFDQQTTATMAVDSYFNQTMDGGLEFQRSVQQFTHETSPESTADGVDLGRMLNLSVGYEYNLKNGTYLSIEPYYKLPLGDMTFANQQFSIGGLNLRMNFRLGK
ncbi:MAG TPA: hypothetical protein VK014_12785 [Cyclobacteriaceae bacterium]|nr:hypothetical protein [Cyclobacteriaceae bacterium]